MNKEYKSYSKIYWILWFILIMLFFLGKIFKIYLLKDIPFFGYFFVITFSFIMIIGLVSNGKLLNYLKKNHYEKWEELTTIQYLGSGLSNGFRLRKFLKSKETLNDPIVEKLKNECKSVLLLTITHIFLFFLLLPLLVIFYG